MRKYLFALASVALALCGAAAYAEVDVLDDYGGPPLVQLDQSTHDFDLTDVALAVEPAALAPAHTDAGGRMAQPLHRDARLLHSPPAAPGVAIAATVGYPLRV